MEEGTLQMGSDYFADGQEYVFPLSLSEYANGMLTSRFGWRTYTNSAGETVTSNHKGLDFSLPYGSSIYAAKTGVVISAGYNGNYGNCIVLLHNDGTETRYAHCSKIDVVVGEYILQGEEIGKVGSTGNATGNCLHFEILYSKDGDWTAVDPLPFISLPHL
jgi:murein DD-endopeptidase MepM/ murein hydrolase activator NlpD